jgi:hypothetical protein
MAKLAMGEGAGAITAVRVEALRLRPCALPAVFIAAGALELDLPEHTERAHLAEFVLSLRTTLPVGWREQAQLDPLTGDEVGVSYSCAFSGLQGSVHPFRLETSARMDAATARAEELLAAHDEAEGVQWDDRLYADEEEERQLAFEFSLSTPTVDAADPGAMAARGKSPGKRQQPAAAERSGGGSFRAGRGREPSTPATPVRKPLALGFAPLSLSVPAGPSTVKPSGKSRWGSSYANPGSRLS